MCFNNFGEELNSLTYLAEIHNASEEIYPGGWAFFPGKDFELTLGIFSSFFVAVH